MLKAISYWSMPGGGEGTCTVKDAFALAKGAGFEALELCIGLEGVLTPETSQDPVANIARSLKTAGW